MITYISREQLEAHPDNPRKDLGDLSELVASISRQGLLQNLTVVPHPEKSGMYRIVIGHRRFAAAGLAGMKEMPCTIDEHMGYAEQLAVMMSENIQRSDLTATEKVGGVQMMMDLGIDAAEIAEKTGISSSTVYRYAKLARLNRKEMAKAEQRGATLMQFAEINEFENAESRKKLLEAVGTAEYSSELYRARNQRAKEKWLPLIARELRKHGATEITGEDWKAHKWLEYIRYDGDHAKQIARLIKKNKQYVYLARDYDLAVYEVREIDPDADKKAEAERIRRERISEKQKAEEELARMFRAKRDDFIRNFDPAGKTEDVLRFTVWLLTRSRYLYSIMVNGIFDTELVSHKDEKEPNYTGSLQISAEQLYDLPPRTLWRALVIAAYERIGNNGMRLMDRYTGKYKPNEELYDLYDHLKNMGYEESVEEMDWLDGNHKVFQSEIDGHAEENIS